MNNIVITDKHHGFVNAIAAGLEGYKAYKQFIAKGEVKDATARSAASRLLAFPEIQELLTLARQNRITAITTANNNVIAAKASEAVEELAPEFFGVALTVENIDQLHYSIVKGLVEVEEVVPVQKKTRDKHGKVIEETVNFMKVKRKPNIRERQASADALYKRWGSYAPARGLFGFGKVGAGDDEGAEPTKKFIMLSNGEKVPFE